MKKLLLVALSAFLISGVAMSQDSTKAKKDCDKKECCKKGSKKACCKKGDKKECDHKKEEKKENN